MNEDEKLKRITMLLEKGCTMLASHHECGAPLFRCKGKILCPICSSSVAKSGNAPIGEAYVVVSQDTDETDKFGRIRAGEKGALSSSVELLQAPDQEHQKDNRPRPSHPDLESERHAQNSGESSGLPEQSAPSLLEDDLEKTKQSMRTAILVKMKDLASDIKEEKDLCRLRSQLDCVNAALRVINALK